MALPKIIRRVDDHRRQAGDMTRPAPMGWTRPNILGWLVYRDQNILDHGRDEAVDVLHRLRSEGWLALPVADVSLTATGAASNPHTKRRLEDEIATGWITGSPLVLDHSPLEFGVFASAEDERDRLKGHRKTVFGGLRDIGVHGRKPQAAARVSSGENREYAAPRTWSETTVRSGADP